MEREDRHLENTVVYFSTSFFERLDGGSKLEVKLFACKITLVVVCARH
jgi:hypothetical protein